MTPMELVDAAAALRLRWRVLGGGTRHIRTDMAGQLSRCPIEAVAMARGCERGQTLGNMARHLGLSSFDASVVMSAADRVRASTDEATSITAPIRAAMIEKLAPVPRGIVPPQVPPL